MNNNAVSTVREMLTVISFTVTKTLEAVWKVACLGITVIFAILPAVSIVH